MDVSKHLKTAIEYKEKGNVHFKAGEYMKAKKAYGHILLYVRGIPGSKRTKTGYEPVVGSQGAMLSETDDAAAFELERTAYQNLAITMLKLEEPRAAMEFCDKAIVLDPTAWKAKLRKAQAVSAMGDIDGAKRLLQDALSNATGEADVNAVSKEMKKLDKQLADYDKKEKAKYAGAFGK